MSSPGVSSSSHLISPPTCSFPMYTLPFSNQCVSMNHLHQETSSVYKVPCIFFYQPQLNLQEHMNLPDNVFTYLSKDQSHILFLSLFVQVYKLFV